MTDHPDDERADTDAPNGGRSDTDPPLPPDVSLRPGDTDDRVGVRRVLDGAALAVEGLPERLAAGDVLVAVADGRIVGAIALDPAGPADSGPDDRVDEFDPLDTLDLEAATHVTAIAVRRRRRDRGIGTALVEAALAREEVLVADFDPSVRPFYESLGFSVVEVGGRCWGRRST